MISDTVYMFCNHPFELSCFAGISNVIREVRPDTKITLILDSMPYFGKTEVDFALKYFDNVEQVGYCDYQAGGIGFGAIAGMAKGFVSTYRFSRQLRAINIKPNSFVFLMSGRFLVSNVLVKVLRKLNPTLVYITRRHPESIDNYVFSYRRSLVPNLYHLFFGAFFVDYFFFRGYGGWPYIQFRQNPYHYTFYTKAPGDELLPDEVFYPFYFPERRKGSSSQGTVVLFGSAFTGWRDIDRGGFISRFNQIIDHIRVKHAGSRLIYKPHPLEKNEKELLNLSGFVVDESATSELLFMKDPSIKTVYSVASTSSRTAPCVGIRSYTLFRLFDLPPLVRTRFEANCYDLPPEAMVESLDQLGNNETDKIAPPDFTPLIRSSTVKMLEKIGFLGE